MLIMVQKEVAERIIAVPGSKDYGKLSILCQLSSQYIKKCFHLAPKSFYPVPKVFSTLIYFKRNDVKIPQFTLLDKLFQNRRKKISNIVSNYPSVLKDRRPDAISPLEYLEWFK